MKFRSWKDYYLFLMKYCKYSCLNCKYGGARVDLNEKHSDIEYARLFCTYSVSMVRFEFHTLCTNYVNDMNFKGLPKGEVWLFSFPEKLGEIFDDDAKEWSIEEIEEAIKEYESK